MTKVGPNSKAVITIFPRSLLRDVDTIAGSTHATRSELIREAVRRYLVDKKEIERQEQRQNLAQLIARSK